MHVQVILHIYFVYIMKILTYTTVLCVRAQYFEDNYINYIGVTTKG